MKTGCGLYELPLITTSSLYTSVKIKLITVSPGHDPTTFSPITPKRRPYKREGGSCRLVRHLGGRCQGIAFHEQVALLLGRV